MSAHEQTRLEHDAQRDLVLRSLQLADSRADRRDEIRRPPRPPKHRYVFPTVTEKKL
jgi:hypothetical protein